MRIATLVAAASLSLAASAADQLWSGTVDSTWDTTTANWAGAATWTNGNTAQFTGNVGTITVNPGVSAAGLIFDGDAGTGFTFAGAPTLIGDANVATLSNTFTVTFDTFFGGSASSITLSGGGVFRFTTDINPGATQVHLSSGTLDLGAHTLNLGITGGAGANNPFDPAPAVPTAASMLLLGSSTAGAIRIGGTGGVGGAPVGPGIGGVGGEGGEATLTIGNGTHTVTTLALGGTGGAGGTTGGIDIAGAGGQGGRGTLNLMGGTLTATTVTIGGESGASGGDFPPAPGGAGGNGLLRIGNDATLAIASGGSLTIRQGGILAFGQDETGAAITLDGPALTGVTSIQNDGAIGFSHASGTFTFAPDVTGSGVLSVNTGGTVLITGNISLTGFGGPAALVSTGTLALADTASISGEIYLGSPTSILEFTGTQDRTFANVISGGGSVTHSGSGIITLTGDNAYNGGVLVSGTGKLVVGSATALGDQALPGNVTVNTSGTLDLNGFSVANAITVSGSLVNNSTTAVTLASGQVGIGAAASLGGSGDMSLADLGASPGASLHKVGAGTLTLAGASAVEALVVDGGRLALASDATLTAPVAPTLTVNTGGAFSSAATTTTVGATVVNSGGTLALAAGRTLTTGNLTLASGSTLALTLGAPATTALAQVNGDITLGGGSVTVEESAPGALGFGLYRLFDYTGSLTGSGLSVTAAPAGAGLAEFSVQTSVTGQVNLVRTAQDALFWDGSGTHGDGVIQGGAGTWSATATNWTNAAGTAVAAQTPNPGAVIFAGTGGAVAVDTADGAVGVTAIQFATSGYTVSGGHITLSGATVVRVGDGTSAGAAMNATIASRLTGTGPLEKTDRGTLTLTGANDYSGDTTVTAGTLAFSQGGRVAGAIVNNATLAVISGADETLANDVSGSGAFTKQGSGTLTVTGALAHTGGTTVEAGTLALDDSGSLAGGVTVNSGATFAIAGSANRTITNIISGDGGFKNLNTGTVTLSSANTYAGGTSVEAGTLALDDTGSILGAVTVNSPDAAFGVNNAAAKTLANNVSGTGYFIKQGAGDLTVTGAIATAGTLLSGGVLTLGAGGSITGPISAFAATDLVFTGADDRTLAGTISGAVTVKQSGTGVTTLSGANSMSAITYALAGTLRAGNDAAFGTGDISVGTTGKLDLNGHTVANTIGAFGSLVNDNTAVAATASGAVTFGNFFTATSSFGGAGDLTISGVVDDLSTSGVTKIGAGRTTLSGNNLYDGGTTITAGTLRAGSATAFGTGAVTVNAAGTADLNGQSLANTFTVSGSLVNNSATAVTLASGKVAIATAASLGGSGALTVTDLGATAGASLTKIGTGTLTLAGASAVESLAVNGGKLTLASGATLTAAAAPALTVNNGGSFDQGGATALTLGATTVNSGGTLALAAGRTLTTGNLTLASGSTLAVTLGAPSTIALAQVNGDLALAGSLAVSETSAGAMTEGVYRLFNYTGALSGVGLAITAAPVGANIADLTVQTSVAGQVNLVRAKPTELLFWDGAQTAANGKVDGGAGTWSKTGTNWTSTDGSKNGARTPETGTVFFSGNAAGTVTVDTAAGALSVSGIRFAHTGYTLSGGSVALSGATTLSVGDGTAPGAAMTATVNTVLTGSGSLTKTDFGTLVLGGANTYSGGTAITAGTLKFTDAGSVVGAIVNNAALIVDNAADKTFANAVSGSGAFTKQGSGTLTVTGALSHTGGTTIAAGTLKLTDTASIAGAIADNGALIVENNSARTFANLVSGSGSFTKQGSGDLTLSSANTYTGATVVSSGKLILGAAQASGAYTLSGGVLELSADERIANTASVTLTGGSLNLNGKTETLATLAVGSAGGESPGFRVIDQKLYPVDGANGVAGAQTIASGSLSATTVAIGGDGGSSSTLYSYSGNGGNGGDASLTLSGGSLTTTNLKLGGDAGDTRSQENGYGGDGGDASLTLSGGSLTTTNLKLGGDASANNGKISGGGHGGTALLTISGGSLTTTNLQLGGDANKVRISGAFAGDASLTLSGGSLTTINLKLGGSGVLVRGASAEEIRTQAFGGAGTLTVSGGTLTATNVTLGNYYAGGANEVAALNLAGGTTSATQIVMNPGASLNVGWNGSASTATATATSITPLLASSILNNGTINFLQTDQTISFGTGPNLIDPTRTAISGNGSIIHNPAASSTTILGGNNTMTGSLENKSGTLVLFGGKALGDSMSITGRAGSTLMVNTAETVGRINFDAGAKLILNAALTLNKGDSIVISTIDAAYLSGPGNIIVNSNHYLQLSNHNTKLERDISGKGSLSLSGSGKTLLDHAHQLDLSGVSVNEGHTLDLGSDKNREQIGNFFIDSSATLSGSGTIVGSVDGNKAPGILIRDGGTVSVGHSPGVLNVTGNYTAAPGSTTIMEIAGTGPAGDPTTGFDQINATGAVVLNGVLDVRLINGYTLAGGGVQNYALFTSASGQLSGTALATGILPSGTFGELTVQGGQLVYTSSDSLAALPGIAGANAALVAAADALFAQTGTTAPGTPAGNLLTIYRSGGVAALNAAGPQSAAAATSLVFDEARATAETIRTRLASHRDGSAKDGGLVGFASTTGSTSATGSDAAYDRRRLGARAGLENELGDGLTLGGFAGYDRGYATLHNRAGRTEQDHLAAAVYLGQRFDNGTFANLGAFGGLSRFEARKNSAAGVTEGETDGYDLGLSGTVGHTVVLAERLSVSPFAGLTWTYAAADRYSETGAVPFSYGEQRDHSLRSTLGANLDWAMLTSRGNTVSLGFSLAWDHELTDNRVAVPASYFGQNVTTSAAPLARDYLTFGPSVAVAWQGGNSLRLGYLNEQSFSGEHGHRFDLTYSKRF